MKTIAVPLSSEAASRLDMDLNEPGDLIEMYLDDEAFQRLWNTGVLQRLNAATGSMIDDFEDESILGDRLEKAIKVLEASSSLISCAEEEELLRMFRKAKYFRTGVYFFF